MSDSEVTSPQRLKHATENIRLIKQLKESCPNLNCSGVLTKELSISSYTWSPQDGIMNLARFLLDMNDLIDDYEDKPHEVYDQYVLETYGIKPENNEDEIDCVQMIINLMGELKHPQIDMMYELMMSMIFKNVSVSQLEWLEKSCRRLMVDPIAQLTTMPDYKPSQTFDEFSSQQNCNSVNRLM